MLKRMPLTPALRVYFANFPAKIQSARSAAFGSSITYGAIILIHLSTG